MLKPYLSRANIEAGCDEAGRGCIAGPVVAAAVILPARFRDPVLNDSKQLSAGIRDKLRRVIEAEALSFGVGFVSEKEIDKINILNASILAMHRAIEKLDPQPESLLVDGNRFKPFKEIPYHCIIKGDSIYSSIAAASVLAKTYRDEHMATLHLEHPSYGWNSNKGYPTRSHRIAVLKYGPTDYHRRTFRLLDQQMALEFKPS